MEEFEMEELCDGKTLDQLFARVGPYTMLAWNDHWSDEEKFADPFFQTAVNKYGHSGWSPLGSYFVTSHDHHVLIWGSTDYLNNFGGLMCFNHHKVQQFDVSPGEKYLVTYNKPKPSDPNVSIFFASFLSFLDAKVFQLVLPINLQGLWLKIFDVKSGKGIVGVNHGGVDSPQWPVIRWAGGKDDQFFATLNKNNTIAVYETETFSPLGGNSLDLDDDVVDIAWSPTESVLAVLLKVRGQQRAKILLLQIPDKVKLVERYLPSGIVVKDCKMYWQNNGDYLAVSMDSGFKFFSIRDEGVPTDFLKLDKKILVAFAWEPSGHRFALIHKGDKATGLSVSFYSMESRGKVTELFTLHNKPANALFWSPRGNLIILAGLKACFGGKLEFVDVELKQTTSVQQHLKANHVVWDPSGRFVATAFTIPQEKFDANYSCEEDDPLERFYVWSSNGDCLYFYQCDYPLIQMEWRPYGGGIIDDDLLEKRKKYLSTTSL
ncbi:unnamed protein product [Eruca vesicaria subsp. sativa]|uniref:Translation initiation factor beta propellor-like domain-containing protein n=1 Tax=Eruca vesicaria subsp. sativa TaxID=29727 RepID=A0ABC8LUH2_ERUVS|nr:unnamed protein product [Eruca vesicaria subsp. sativa]